MTFASIKNFFEVHSGDFKEKLGNGRITLINFVDFQDIKERHIPTLKVQAFEKFVESSVPSGNLNNQNVEQHLGLWSYCSIFNHSMHIGLLGLCLKMFVREYTTSTVCQ